MLLLLHMPEGPASYASDQGSGARCTCAFEEPRSQSHILPGLVGSVWSCSLLRSAWSDQVYQLTVAIQMTRMSHKMPR